MPEPFEKPDHDPERLADALEKGARAQQILALGAGDDLERRRQGIWAQAERELRAGTLNEVRALMHIACSNALSRYHAELKNDITEAQSAADKLHAEADEPADGDI